MRITFTVGLGAKERWGSTPRKKKFLFFTTAAILFLFMAYGRHVKIKVLAGMFSNLAGFPAYMFFAIQQ